MNGYMEICASKVHHVLLPAAVRWMLAIILESSVGRDVASVPRALFFGMKSSMLACATMKRTRLSERRRGEEIGI